MRRPRTMHAPPRNTAAPLRSDTAPRWTGAAPPEAQPFSSEDQRCSSKDLTCSGRGAALLLGGPALLLGRAGLLLGRRIAGPRRSSGPRRRRNASVGVAMRGVRCPESRAKRKPHHCGSEDNTGNALRYAAFGSVDRDRLVKREASDACRPSRL